VHEGLSTPLQSHGAARTATFHIVIKTDDNDNDDAYIEIFDT
jgi:hypothetical protein